MKAPRVPLASLATDLFDSARFSFFLSFVLVLCPRHPSFFPFLSLSAPLPDPLIPLHFLDFSFVFSSSYSSLRFLFFALAFILSPFFGLVLLFFVLFGSLNPPLFFNFHSSLLFSPFSRTPFISSAFPSLLFALISVFPLFSPSRFPRHTSLFPPRFDFSFFLQLSFYPSPLNSFCFL